MKKSIYRVALLVSGEVIMRVRAKSIDDARHVARELYGDDGCEAKGFADENISIDHSEAELDTNQDAEDGFGVEAGCAFGYSEEDEC